MWENVVWVRDICENLVGHPTYDSNQNGTEKGGRYGVEYKIKMTSTWKV